MSRSRYFARILLIVVVVLGLTGCTPDLVEVDAINMVLALGIDEVGTKVRVSAEIVAAQGAQGGVQQQRTSQFLVKESTGDSIETAVENLNQLLPRRTFLPHNTIVIFGKTYAEHGLDRAFDYLERDRAYRRNELLLVTPRDARDVLQQDTAPEPINAMGVRQLVEQFSDMSPILNSQQLRVMREYLQASHSVVLTAVDLDSDRKPKIAGVGVLDGGKLVTCLNMQETEGLIWHMGNTRSIVVDVPSTNRAIDKTTTFRLLTTHTDVKPELVNGIVQIHYKVRGRAELIRTCPGTKIETKTLKKMEQALDKNISGCMQRTMKTVQDNQTDAVQSGNRMFQQAPRAWRAVATDWNSKFAKAKVTYDVKIHLIRTGLSSSEPSSDYTPEQFPPKAGKEPRVQ